MSEVAQNQVYQSKGSVSEELGHSLFDDSSTQSSGTVNNRGRRENSPLRFLYAKLFKLKGVPVRIENLPFFLAHLAPLGLFFVEFHWGLVYMAIILYFTRMFAITGFYHRYFSHRGYKVPSRIVQFLMAAWGATSAQQGALWWSSHHRHHHRHSDTEHDLHSPTLQGFIYSHVLWIINNRELETFKDREKMYPKDFAIYPELLWLERFNLLMPVLLGVAVFLIYSWAGVIWFLISTMFLWHGTFTINSLSHMFGRRRFDTTDTSRNNIALAMLTLGEGWHNNHHAYAGGAKAGFYWYEIDITYYGLLLMSKLGLIRDLGAPPKRILTKGRVNDQLRRQARHFLPARIIKKLDVEDIKIVVERISQNVDQKVLRHLGLNELKAMIERFKEEGLALTVTDTSLQPVAV